MSADQGNEVSTSFAFLFYFIFLYFLTFLYFLFRFSKGVNGRVGLASWLVGWLFFIFTKGEILGH